MCWKQQNFDMYISDIWDYEEEDSHVSTQPNTPDIIQTFKKASHGPCSEGWYRSTRSTVAESLTGMLEIEDDPIREHYTFGKIVSFDDHYIIREGFSKDFPQEKVLIKWIEWSEIEKDHQAIASQLQILKEADNSIFYANIEDSEYMYIVTEYADGMELSDYITENYPIKEEWAVVIIHQLLNKLRHLASLEEKHGTKFINIVNKHNIIIDPDSLEVKFLNCGVTSNSFLDKNNHIFHKFSPKSTPNPTDCEGLDDLWNLGYLLSKMWKCNNSEIMDFILKCKSRDQNQKITLKEAINHEFLKFRNSAKFALRLSDSFDSRLSSIENSVSSSNSSFYSF